VTRRLLAHAQRIASTTRLAAAVGTDDGGDPLLEGQNRTVDEGLEARNLQRLDAQAHLGTRDMLVERQLARSGRGSGSRLFRKSEGGSVTSCYHPKRGLGKCE
jgi:hypothetical protein